MGSHGGESDPGSGEAEEGTQDGVDMLMDEGEDGPVHGGIQEERDEVARLSGEVGRHVHGRGRRHGGGRGLKAV